MQKSTAIEILKYTFLVLFSFPILFGAACKTSGGKEGVVINSSPAADIYCSCLVLVDTSNGSSKYESPCLFESIETWYKDVPGKSSHVRHIQNTDTLTKLGHLIYSGELVQSVHPGLANLNLFIFYTKRDNHTDSFAFQRNKINSLVINKDSAINYRFNILDSIGKILGSNDMSCSD